MENEGYEEDQSRAKGGQSTFETSNRDQLHSDSSSAIATHLDGHVYEDISTDIERTLEFSETSSSDKSGNAHEIKDLRSLDATNQAWVSRPLSIVSPTIDRYFRNNSTLSPLAGISANRESPVSSSLAASMASDDDSAKLSKNSCDLRRDIAESVSLESSRENEGSTRDALVQSDRRPNRRRRKKDCKHCRSKLTSASSCERLNELADDKDVIFEEDTNKHPDKDLDVTNFSFREPFPRSQNLKIYPVVNRASLRDISVRKDSYAFPAFSENRLGNATNTLPHIMDKEISGQVVESNQIKMYPESNGAFSNGIDMRINSIYSQERWYGKELPIFYTDVKDQSSFQRAYSLPAWTHSPTSQNRANLRRSVRNDPPPHPARLDKHRRGWTLHLVRPLKASEWSSPLIPLLIVVLILLGVAGVALYIVFEPEKIQIIQQYLKSSTSKLMGENLVDVTPAGSITSAIPNDEPSSVITTTEAISMMTKMNVDTFTLLNSESSFPESTSLSTATEAETASQDVNATRYCDDCFEGEVCVALASEEVPTCRSPRDREDPTGCAGFCIVNKQKCHRLDVDAFRCMEIEHHCLDDEWTCSNTLCIPLEKHCDGHMNCYDHTDEYDCICNLETHFHCGNKTSCLPLKKRCDGKIDCWDAADEINCTLGRNLDWFCPLDSEFTCSNGECILKARFCDGLSDCSDGSDEPYGCQGRCNKHEFTCQNRRCITKNLKCNGIDDCGDGTDERHCKDRFT